MVALGGGLATPRAISKITKKNILSFYFFKILNNIFLLDEICGIFVVVGSL
jgi:hypothetical protein